MEPTKGRRAVKGLPEGVLRDSAMQMTVKRAKPVQVVDPRTSLPFRGREREQNRKQISSKGGSSHRRSNSWGQLGEAAVDRRIGDARGATSRSPSPFAHLNDVDLYMSGLGRTRSNSNSPSVRRDTASPGPRTRTVKYVGPPSRNNGTRVTARSPAPLGYAILGTSAPTEMSRRDMSSSPPRRTPGFSPNSSFRSAAELKLKRELDDFEQELAEINSVERNISLLTLDDVLTVDDGHKPGDLKFIKASRFQSPKHSRFEAEPPKGAAKPVGVPMDSAVTITAANAPIPLTGFQVTRQQRSAFFPTRLVPAVAL